MDLSKIEKELKKRLMLPYNWGTKQNNSDDKATDFIYSIYNFDILVKEIETRFIDKPNYQALKNYALNRWFNFWSAQAVEHIFCSLPSVVPDINRSNRLVDFSIQGIKFDHKTSVFPRGFGKTLTDAQSNPRELMQWFYKNQSQQRRMHLKNRLFLVMYSTSGNHWKLKSEIAWLNTIIENYINTFNVTNLHKFNFEGSEITLSDIVWAIK